MKKFIIILFVLCSSILYSAFTLNGGISYTVQSAREISFNDISYSIDVKKFESYFIDKNNVENLKALSKCKKKYKNRYLTKYQDGSYSVVYTHNTNIGYFYTLNGTLTHICYDKNKSFPSKRVTYNINGSIDSVTLDVSKDEQFIFDINKKLVAHWIGKNCYNEQGELINTRN